MNALHRIAALLHRNKNVSTRTNSKRLLRLESLEERQLLSVTPLGWFPEMEYVTEISPSRPNDDNNDGYLRLLADFQTGNSTDPPGEPVVLPPQRTHGTIKPLQFVKVSPLAPSSPAGHSSAPSGGGSSGGGSSGGSSCPSCLNDLTVSISQTGDDSIYEWYHCGTDDAGDCEHSAEEKYPLIRVTASGHGTAGVRIALTGTAVHGEDYILASKGALSGGTGASGGTGTSGGGTGVSGGGGGGPERGSAYYTGCGSAVWTACSPVPSYTLSVLQSPIREGETGNSAYPLDALLHLTSSWPYADTNYIKIVNGGFIDTTGCDYGFSAVDITKFGGVISWGQGIAASFTGGEITLTFRAEDDAIPHYDNEVEIDFYVGCYPDDNSGCGGFYGCGWQTQVHGAKSGTVTVKDNDNWEIGVSVIDDEALEPCTWIPGNQRTGAFEITKQPGDEFCVDDSYDIFVEFTLGGTALPFSMGPNPRDYHITTNPNGGDPNAMAVYVGSKNVWRTKIPAGQDSLKLYVMPDGDHIFENDETVTLMITEAYAVEGHNFNVSDTSSAVTLLQAPEFISDTDEAVNVTKDNYTAPFAVNGDNYYGYIRRNAEAGKKVNNVTEIFAANNRGVKYSIVSGNEAGLFQINENTGVITTAVSLKNKTNLAASYSLIIEAYDPQHSLQYDRATVNVFTKFDLDVDSDNNGYINDPTKNEVRADAEDAMEGNTGKPITYFAQTTGVPPDYYYVPLRVSRDPSITAATRFSFDYEGSVEVYESKNGAHPLGKGEKYNIASLKGEYYARALGTNSGDVILRLHNAAGNVIAKDSVLFDVQDNADAPDWVVPSGWKIDGGSLTTFMPVEDAVGPQDEGSYYKDNPLQKRGTAFSKNTYENGFTMEFEYSFERNGDNGYLQPDTENPKERIDGDDTKKVSFVGNSGIKLGGYWGRFATSTKGGITEVAILDMPSMVACVGGVNNFKTKIDANGDVIFSPNEGYDKEHISQLLNGIVYGDKDFDKHIVGASGQSYQEIFEQNYNLFSGNGAKMKVVYSGAPLGILSVYVWKNGAYMKYYEKSGVSITGDGRDERVYLQSHWGSGVTFSDITIQ